MSAQATSRVARNRLGARERAQAARGLTGSQRVSELVTEADIPAPTARDKIRTAKDRRERRLEEIFQPDLKPLGEFVDANSGERSVLAGRGEPSGRAVGAVDRETDHRGETGRVD